MNLLPCSISTGRFDSPFRHPLRIHTKHLDMNLPCGYLAQVASRRPESALARIGTATTAARYLRCAPVSFRTLPCYRMYPVRSSSNHRKCKGHRGSRGGTQKEDWWQDHRILLLIFWG